MFKLIFTNSKGESVELFSYPYRLMRFEGLGDVGAIHQSQKSYNQDGSTLVNTTLDGRHPEIELKITGRDEIELARNRRRLTHVFNPKLGEGTLKRVSEDGTHQLKAIAESIPYYPDGAGNRSRTSQKTLINLYCPNPYWQDIAESKTDISTETGNLEFPLEIPSEGLELSIRTISFITNIYNQGDVDAPIKVKLKAVGTVINPIIENLDTDEFIRVKRELAEGDTLEINTAFGNKRVEIIKPDGSRENVFNYIDYKSTFFSLSGGDNTIKYDAEVGENNLDVSIYYTPNYLGI